MPDSTAAGRAFSAQSPHFDAIDRSNAVIGDLRQQVYRRIQRHIAPQSRVLEINAGTGIDAGWFVSQGHSVLATDVSDGMIAALRSKMEAHDHQGRLRVRQLSYEELDQLKGEQFDFVFSNFGGLNCVKDLTPVINPIRQLLTSGGHICFVIMPPVCPWEVLSILKGNKTAFRRWKKDGTMAHLEGHYFKTYYHSLGQLRRTLGPDFTLRSCEGLAAISPPPHQVNFPGKYPRLYSILRKTDDLVNTWYPFNRWADHIIATFRYTHPSA